MLTRREFVKYAGLGAATILGMNVLGCTSKNVKEEAQKPVTNAYKDEFVLGYGKDHKLKGGKWGIGFFPKINTLERLVEYDLKKDEYVPYLARKWEVEKNGKVITFDLVKGVKFSDGSDFTASAVKFTVLWLAANHPLGSETFEGADVVDDYSVSIRYKEEGFFNLAKMAEFHMSIMSPKSVTPEGDVNGTFVFPVGTGPLKVADYKEDEYAIYEPNTYWYERYGIEPKFKKLTVKIIRDEDTRVMALRSGEVDAISDYSHGGSDYTPRNQLNLLKKDGYEVFKRVIPLTWIVAFNYEKEPFNDVDARKAVDLAVNRDEIVKIFDNQVLPARTLFMDSAPGIKEAKAEGIVYECNPDEARNIVESKGIEGELSMIVDKSQGDQILVSQLIQQQLKNVGLNVNLEILESGAYKEKRDSGDYDLRLYYIGGTDRRFYMRIFWRFHPDTKWKAYMSEKTGDLCKKILKEFDGEKRRQYLVEFYKAIHDEHGVVPLYFDIMTVAASPKVDASYDVIFKLPNGVGVGEPLFYGVGVRA